jgi:hypothetical protein
MSLPPPNCKQRLIIWRGASLDPRLTHGFRRDPIKCYETRLYIMPAFFPALCWRTAIVIEIARRPFGSTEQARLRWGTPASGIQHYCMLSRTPGSGERTLVHLSATPNLRSVSISAVVSPDIQQSGALHCFSHHLSFPWISCEWDSSYLTFICQRPQTRPRHDGFQPQIYCHTHPISTVLSFSHRRTRFRWVLLAGWD